MESASYIPNRDLKTAVAPFPEDGYKKQAQQYKRNYQESFYN
jgi:hypothetical protein